MRGSKAAEHTVVHMHASTEWPYLNLVIARLFPLALALLNLPHTSRELLRVEVRRQIFVQHLTLTHFARAATFSSFATLFYSHTVRPHTVSTRLY